MRHRWLPDFPNYQQAETLEAVPANISPREFRKHFVNRHRPCVIREAARHWRAVEQWTPDHLRSVVGSVPVGRNHGFRAAPWPMYNYHDVLIEAASPLNGPMTYATFFDLLAESDFDMLQLNSEPLDLLKELAGDLGGLPFLHAAGQPARGYPARLFLSRAGYTDWHAHTADDTIAVQLRGPKEFLMLPPDRATAEALAPLRRRGVWSVQRNYWPPSFAALVPTRCVLAPGDAVYIPMHWWHAAESLDTEFNVTFAHVFATPLRWLGDLRIPNARFSLVTNLLLGALHSAKLRDVRPLESAARLALTTLASFPIALALNRWPSPAPTPARCTRRSPFPRARIGQ